MNGPRSFVVRNPSGPNQARQKLPVQPRPSASVAPSELFLLVRSVSRTMSTMSSPSRGERGSPPSTPSPSPPGSVAASSAAASSLAASTAALTHSARHDGHTLDSTARPEFDTGELRRDHRRARRSASPASSLAPVSGALILLSYRRGKPVGENWRIAMTCLLELGSGPRPTVLRSSVFEYGNLERPSNFRCINTNQ